MAASQRRARKRRKGGRHPLRGIPGCRRSIELIADPVVLNIDRTGALVPTGPFQLGAGFPTKGTLISGSVQIPLVFTPSTTGNFSGELDIATNDATTANFKLPLTGCGT